MTWNRDRVAWMRDTTYDRETVSETIAALAEAIHALTFPNNLLIPATVDQLAEALKIDYENGGFFDIGTFACGVCLANGTTYEPWNDEALQWLRDNMDELRLAEFVGAREDRVNLCPECAEWISGLIWERTDSQGAVPPPIDMFADSAPTSCGDTTGTDLDV